MDYGFFVDLITNLGFPIACVVVLAVFAWKMIQTNEQNQKEREDKLYFELGECRQINDKAIQTIAQYADRLEGIQADVKEIKTDITVIKSKIE